MSAETSDAGWKWYGYAGHFIAASDCRFHLATRVGGYLISSVGDYRPRGDREERQTIGAAKDSFFETYVFECLGEDKNGDPIVKNYSEIDGERYAESIDAERGHYRYCHKYASLAAGEQEGIAQ